jgi:hypothetical protein
MKIKAIHFLVLFFVVFVLFSCKNDTAPSGITGYIYFAKTSCNGQGASPAYSYYHGNLYFVSRNVYDTLIQVQLDTTSSWLIRTPVTNGRFGTLIEPGYYWFFIDSMPYTANCQSVEITKDKLLEKNFYFLKCQ